MNHFSILGPFKGFFFNLSALYKESWGHAPLIFNMMDLWHRNLVDSQPGSDRDCHLGSSQYSGLVGTIILNQITDIDPYADQ